MPIAFLPGANAPYPQAPRYSACLQVPYNILWIVFNEFAHKIIIPHQRKGGIG